MDESESREVWFLNRDLLVVRPKEPYVEWARTVYDDEPITDEEARDWVDAFLLPECDTEEEALDWIAENCDVIFELMLADWVVEPEAWPEDRGWEVCVPALVHLRADRDHLGPRGRTPVQRSTPA